VLIFEQRDENAIHTTIGLVAMAAGNWNNGHLFSIWLLFRQTFAIWLFVVNFIFSFSIGFSCGLTFFNAATAPSRQRYASFYMSRIIIIALFAFTASKSFAQIKFANDTADYKPFSYEKGIDSVFHLKNENEFELRFTIRPSSLIPGAKRTLLLMTLNNHLWQARLFQYSNYPQDKYWEISVDTANLDELWTKLLKQNILKIKNGYLLKDEHGEIARTNMKDGITYTIRLISKSAQRSYSYYSPQSAMEDYPKIKEFRQVTKMIDLLSTYCSLKSFR
jgi:hypothetical protein